MITKLRSTSRPPTRGDRQLDDGTLAATRTWPSAIEIWRIPWFTVSSRSTISRAATEDENEELEEAAVTLGAIGQPRASQTLSAS